MPYEKCIPFSDPDTGEINRRRTRDSDSESDLSLDHASLDLASSHSSDEDEYNGDTWKKKVASKPPGKSIFLLSFGTFKLMHLSQEIKNYNIIYFIIHNCWDLFL